MPIFKSFAEILSVTPKEIAALYPFLVVHDYFEADVQPTAPAAKPVFQEFIVRNVLGGDNLYKAICWKCYRRKQLE